MADTFNSTKARIFRITHRENMKWILDNGLYSPSSGRFDGKHKSIGSPDLIEKRTARVIPVGPCGTLNDYIPFYFTPFSIMMYNIHTGYNVVPVANDDIVILVSSLHKVDELGIPFVFTDQHAFRKTASYFTDLKDLDQIDWPLLNRRNFRYDAEDLAKTDRYQAEALIWKHLPLEGLLGIVVCNEEINAVLMEQILKRGIDLKTEVRRGLYFQ